MSDTRTHTGPAMAGLVLGSYRILEELSTGGMGTVFRAQHVLLGRPAAVKLLRRDLTTSPELVQRFVNEARAVTACKHPGIVEVYDFGYTADGHAFIVMEFLDGESLGGRLARVALAEVEAAAIAHGIASALKAAHRVGVIHRDLKPDNVFLVPDPDGGVDRTKVLDFGIAKLADGAPTSQSTQTGALIGTPLYMAPEQARAAAAIDARADLYSLGCILYHMLTGRPPFVADGAGEIIALQMFEAVVPPSRLAQVSPDMERVVLRLLEKHPADRFGNAGEVVAALTRLDHRPTRRMTLPTGVATDSLALQLDQTGALQLDQTGALTPARRRRPAALVAGVLGALALTAVGIGYAMSRDVGSAAALPGAAPLVVPTAPAPASPPSPSQLAAEPPRALDPVRVPAPGAQTTAPEPTPTSTPERPAPRVVPGSHKPVRGKTAPGVGAITPSGDVHLPEQPTRVHRGPRGIDPPGPGEHTAGGAPIEDTVDIDTKPKLPKDSRSP